MFSFGKKKQSFVLNRRSLILLIGKFSLFSIVGLRLFNIQILQSNKYKTLSENNQINFEVIYPVRGQILDRNGLVIASNKNTYDLFLIPEQTPSVEKTLHELNKIININYRVKRKVIELSKKIKKFQSIIILKNINWEDLEIIEANKYQLPGLHIKLVPQRLYPYHAYLSHILGYTNKPSEQDLNLPFINDMLTLDIGKTGIEKITNEQLIGRPGKREIEVNSIGKEIREISRINSEKGKNIKISIDINIQKYAHEQLSKHKAGSVVVMDIDTGEIVSMVSIPDYNPNLIIKKPNVSYWNTILNNSLAPLTNRSIQGLYSPGSTFKMIVALAGLRKGVISTKDSVICEGKIEFGDRFYHCWKTKGHGKVRLIKGLKESCDIYFYELSKKIGIDEIAKTAKEFGLGELSNMGLENEKKGIIPSIKWKKQNLKKSWYAGETLIAGIGQGYILSTPIQLAIMTARIASSGKVQASIIEKNSREKFNKINFHQDHIALIKEGMFKVVNEEMGTAYKSKSNSFKFSGKTGTSQVKKIELEERESEDFRKIEKEWKNKDHALFVGYMPSEKPKYSISVIIEHGGSGASVAAPIAKNIFNYINNINYS